ncbi:MAG: hypothetical protein ACRDPA_20050 [Solirubrobacteraceae bacterium]
MIGFAGALVAGATHHREVLQPLVLVTVLTAPALLPRRLLYPPPPPAPPSSGADDDWGGGGGRRNPPRPPQGPSGGLLLPDAGPFRARIRDHGRPALTRFRARRPAHQPERAPARTPRGYTPA